ncbi:MAG: transglycosylase SLT domain-containing protein [Sandaracinaceae bacterium]|nr:transglycosylase SLT domain-containing protein [Sandaracinaceae bacterium]
MRSSSGSFFTAPGWWNVVLLIASCNVIAKPLHAESEQVLEIDAFRERLASHVRNEDGSSLDRFLNGLESGASKRLDVCVVRGWLALKSQQWEEATFAFEEALALAPPWLRPWILERLIPILIRTEQLEKAESFLNTVPSLPPPFQAMKVQILAKRGRIEEAENELSSVPPTASIDIPSLRARIAEAVNAFGDRNRALRLLRTLLLEAPQHPEAPSWESQLAGWTGQKELNWTAEERLIRAKKLLDAHQAQKALVELEKMGRPRMREMLRDWAALKGRALFSLRHRYREAAELLEEACSIGCTVEEAFLAARARFRGSGSEDGIAALARFATHHRNHPLAIEAHLLIAKEYVGEGNLEEAKRWLQRTEGLQSSGHSHFLSELYWRLGWIEYKQGNWGAAASHFERSANTADSAMEQAKGYYWAAKSLDRLGERQAAQRLFEQVIRVEPLGWYALWAIRAIRQGGHAPVSPLRTESLPSPSLVASFSDPPLFRFLWSIGLDEEALEVLREEESKNPRPPLRFLVERYLALRAFSRAMRLVAGHEWLSFPPLSEALWVWRAAYPTPYANEASLAASEQGLPEALLYAVMRHESAFNPSARSRAGAVGLMQLLPSTARRIGAKLGLPVADQRLTDPAVNMRLGACYLREMLSRWPLPLALAAYNAGEHRVQKWRQKWPLPIDEFVEHIPFSETHHYVRKVVGSHARYTYLKRVEEGGSPLEWPELDDNGNFLLSK